MIREFSAGDMVIFEGEVFEVLRKRVGLNFYEIGKRYRHNGQDFFTCVRDGLYSDQLTPVTEATIENAMDIAREMKRNQKCEDC